MSVSQNGRGAEEVLRGLAAPAGVLLVLGCLLAAHEAGATATVVAAGGSHTCAVTSGVA